jgi:hypothetical protein
MTSAFIGQATPALTTQSFYFRPKGDTTIGNKSDKAKEEALRAENQRLQNQYQQQIDSWKPGPYEQALNDEGLAWINATDGKNPLDISKLPGMAPWVDIYSTATAKQQGQRLGTGMMGYGSAMANPTMLAALAQQEEAHRRQDAGAQLSNAFAMKDAEVRGTALPLIGIGENRESAKVGTTAQMANSAAQRWASHQIRPGFWSNLLDQMTRGMSQGATMAAGA